MNTVNERPTRENRVRRLIERRTPAGNSWIRHTNTCSVQKRFLRHVRFIGYLLRQPRANSLCIHFLFIAHYFFHNYIIDFPIYSRIPLPLTSLSITTFSFSVFAFPRERLLSSMCGNRWDISFMSGMQRTNYTQRPTRMNVHRSLYDPQFPSVHSTKTTYGIISFLRQTKRSDVSNADRDIAQLLAGLIVFERITAS